MKQPAKRRDYRNALGEKVPGVTTVIGDSLGWKTHSLIQWAHRLGKEGRSLSERDQAADKGTATHALVARMLGHDDGTELDDDEIREHTPNADRIVEAIRSRWEVLHVEFAIVSERYAGTIDLVCKDKDGHVGIVDLKTGNGVYDEVCVQLAAYINLLGGGNVGAIAGWASIIHAHPGLPLEVIDVPSDSLNAAREVFGDCLSIYEAKKRVKVRP